MTSTPRDLWKGEDTRKRRTKKSWLRWSGDSFKPFIIQEVSLRKHPGVKSFFLTRPPSLEMKGKIKWQNIIIITQSEKHLYKRRRRIINISAKRRNIRTLKHHHFWAIKVTKCHGGKNLETAESIIIIIKLILPGEKKMTGVSYNTLQLGSNFFQV